MVPLFSSSGRGWDPGAAWRPERMLEMQDYSSGGHTILRAASVGPPVGGHRPRNTGWWSPGGEGTARMAWWATGQVCGPGVGCSTVVPQSHLAALGGQTPWPQDATFARPAPAFSAWPVGSGTKPVWETRARRLIYCCRKQQGLAAC